MPFDYFYGIQAEQFHFVKVPKNLIQNECFKELSVEAKVLYGLLIDRMGSAIKNQWIDNEKRVYVIYPIDEIMNDLNVTKKKAIQYLSELENSCLIEKHSRGAGLTNFLYIKKYVD